MTFDLEALGWADDLALSYHPYDRVDCRPGRVLRADRGICTVATRTGLERASLGGLVLNAAAADPVRLPCAGDWVALRRWPDRRHTVEAVLPRRTAVIRRTADKDASGQVLAANADVVAVVEPMHPEPDAGRIERLLALAWDSGGQPVLVLTKCDVSADPAAIVRQFAEHAPDTPVLAVSVQDGTGLDELRELVPPGRTLALLGPSGAGKSSLVNALAGALVTGTQEIRRADGKGRHTTTFRALVPVPRGGAVIDTPGLRGVGLLDGATGVDHAFADVTALARGCRFRDCAHAGEPDCAVAAAIAGGDLTARRLTSWRALRREVAAESGRVRAAQASRLGRARRHQDHRPSA
jgi:ribosome biogenesis GTPase